MSGGARPRDRSQHPAGEHDADQCSQENDDDQDDQGEADAGSDVLAHLVLGDENVGDDIGQWPVIADRTGKHEIHPFFDAAVKDSTLNEPLLHRLSDSARLTNRVNRPKMVLMALTAANLFVQVHSKRSTIQSAFNVVDRQSVSCEENIHVVILDEFDEVSCRAGVHKAGTCYNQDAAIFAARLARSSRSCSLKSPVMAR